MNYRISWDKLTKDDNGNFVNKKYNIIVSGSTKREVDEIVDEMTTNLLYSNIRLEKEGQ